MDLEQLRRKLTHAVARLAPASLSADRDDIVQVALMRLMKIFPTGEGSGPSAASYLWKTAFSVTVDEIRRRARRPETPLESAAGVLDVVAEGRSPEAALQNRQLGDAIRGCLQKLPRDRRSAVVLSLVGHPVREVGERLGWNVKKAENAVYRGMAALRQCLTLKGIRP